MSRFVDVSRVKNLIQLSLTRRATERGGYELVWFLDSLKAMYKNSGVGISFADSTQAIHDSLRDEAVRIERGFTPGQSIFFRAVMAMLASPASGDLEENLRSLMLLQWIFDKHDFSGDSKQKLRYTTRFTGDRYGRIVTFKEDIRKLHGDEACALVCTALSASIKRTEGKPCHFHGIESSNGPAPSKTGNLTYNFAQIRHALLDEITAHDESWIKANFHHVVAIAQFFETLAAEIAADEVVFSESENGWLKPDNMIDK